MVIAVYLEALCLSSNPYMYFKIALLSYLNEFKL